MYFQDITTFYLKFLWFFILIYFLKLHFKMLFLIYVVFFYFIDFIELYITMNISKVFFRK